MLDNDGNEFDPWEEWDKIEREKERRRPFDYSEWFNIAAFSGIDWDNPPPREMLTEELCIAALEDAWQHLEKIPVELKTFDVCFAAVFQDDAALQYVPPALRGEVKQKKDSITNEQWLRELSCYNGNHYLKLPCRLLTPEFCREMVSINGYTLELIPEDCMTEELRQIAEAQDKMENWQLNIRFRSAPIVKSGTQIVMENSLRRE